MATRAGVRRHRFAAPPDPCRQRPENDLRWRRVRRDPDRLWHPPTGGYVRGGGACPRLRVHGPL